MQSKFLILLYYMLSGAIDLEVGVAVVLIAVDNVIKTTALILDHITSQSPVINIITESLCLAKRTVIIVAAYIPLRSAVGNINHSFFYLLINTPALWNDNLIILGDFNIPTIKDISLYLTYMPPMMY